MIFVSWAGSGPRIFSRCSGPGPGAVHDATPKGLNGLVNNAGAAFSSKALSPDGYERTIAINHVALAALTEGSSTCSAKALTSSPHPREW